jgi:hypothetical protein
VWETVRGRKTSGGSCAGRKSADLQSTAAKSVGLADVSRRSPFERGGGSLRGASCVARRSDAYRWKTSWVVESASFHEAAKEAA